MLDRLKRSIDNNTPSLQLTNFENKGYYVQSIFTANYFQAMQFCHYHGMRLLSITSKKENDFIEGKIRKMNLEGHHWTSGTILPSPDPWIWMYTGNSMIYTHWDIGEPSLSVGNSSEECLEVRIIRGGLWWNDLNCLGLLNFICDTPLRSNGYRYNNSI
ncbi:perlucin-like [Anoplophora glabripennis]|uniref:perlucin-like n=1 Tax=Anoplophora glabripennis TaxID=217634 RepID=UPI0008753062|nr:perlucin-like [Anoplophora glabripennis]